jgi:hypothetical protein
MSAAAVSVRLVCGCVVEVLGSATDWPVCEPHAERRVANVTAPAPRIVAYDVPKTATLGPLVRIHAE